MRSGTRFRVGPLKGGFGQSRKLLQILLSKLCQGYGIDVLAEIFGLGLIGLKNKNSNKALILSHPLWHSREGLIQDEQDEAKMELVATYPNINCEVYRYQRFSP